ncbi:MAG: hypothetical protein JST79_22440 [Acidobacteria bacterium]|jgi:hypothetical protein|nr:hypothetical protein [Acidobacteriota bacterium]
MPQEILSIAVFQPCLGKEKESLQTLQELFAVLAAAGHSRDLLYRDTQAAEGCLQYVLLRYWKSEAARRAAQEDAEVQRCWAKLGNEVRIVTVYETLQGVEG